VDALRKPARHASEAFIRSSAAAIVLGAALGAILGAVAVPIWLPDLTASLLGPSPQAYWYLSRSTGVAAYLLIWQSMIFGLLITGRLSRVWPGGPAAIDLHQFTALLGLGFGAMHAVVLLADQYIGYGPAQIFIPFGSQAYRPLAVGLGQLGLYLGAVLSFSFYLRRRIGYRVWRLIHSGSFACYFLVTVHGLTAGTDSGVLLPMYVTTTLVTLFLTLFRILSAARDPVSISGS
jgi:predicted ferric reductase